MNLALEAHDLGPDPHALGPVDLVCHELAEAGHLLVLAAAVLVVAGVAN